MLKHIFGLFLLFGYFQQFLAILDNLHLVTLIQGLFVDIPENTGFMIHFMVQVDLFQDLVKELPSAQLTYMTSEQQIPA